MGSILIGVYANQVQAQGAYDDLIACGFSAEELRTIPSPQAGDTNKALSTITAIPRDESLADSLRDLFYKMFGGEHAAYRDKYAEAVRRGRYLLMADVDNDERGEQAMQVMQRHDPVGVDENAGQIKRGVRVFQRAVDTPEADYRRHFQTTYGATGDKYEDYAQAYRYGATLAGQEHYRGYRWSDAEPNLRQAWESDRQSTPWERIKDAVRYGWEKITR
jgi:hypothetical protein